jgi:tight adherence protein C
MELVLLTFTAVFLLVLTGVLLVFYRQQILTRLSSAVSPRPVPAEEIVPEILAAGSPTAIERVMEPFQRVLPRTPEEVGIIQKRLIWAGYRKDSHVNVFYATKVLVPALLAVLVTATDLYLRGPFFVYGMALGLGFLLPDFYLGQRIRARQDKVRLGLPEALDLMVICIEAGLGLDQAVVRVADELRLSQPIIAEELNQVNLEQRAGRPRTEAWHNLAERTDVESVRALASMLIQSDQFGTSIAKSLRVHAEGLRTRRRQQAEEEAAKTTVKLVFPLVIFIFPSLFLVVLGPSIITIKEALNRFLLR